LGRKTETVTVDGTAFEIRQLGAVRGKALWDRLARSIGGVLGEVAGAIGASKEQQAGVVLKALAVLPQDLLDQLDEAFAANCRVKQGELWIDLGNAHTEDNIFDQTFAGAYEKLIGWRLKCLEVNFAGFLSKLGASSAKPKTSPAP
jgi:hypothetical protein